MGRRPGRSLATLLAAGAVSNLGDGVTLAAAPLLAASVTRDPRAIGAVGVAWSLPWLLFALVSGAVVDRSDRRRLMVGADLVRVVGLAGLTAAVVGGRRSRPWWRCSSSTPPPRRCSTPPGRRPCPWWSTAMTCPGPTAGSRRSSSPATGSSALPSAGCCSPPPRPPRSPSTRLAQDVLGLDARGYGLLLACLAVGGVLGGTVAARLHRRVGDQGSVVGSILLMSTAWALLAATTLPVVAGAGIALYGLAAVWWNVVTVSFRQAVVPERLQGRVNSAYRLVTWGTLSVGAAAGGVVAAQLGLRFLYGVAAVVLLAGLAWRLLDAGSFAAARTAAGPSPEARPA
ncbi:MAG TPA: MFS transporter [Actinomycetota bacterium]|jgi:MFS family permease